MSIFYVRSGKRKFSKKVTSSAPWGGARPEISKLVQWTYRVSQTNKFGEGVKHSFLSIVRRSGYPGWWIDSPYFIYSGDKPHKYKRLNSRVVAKLYVALIRGQIEKQRLHAIDFTKKCARAVCSMANKYSPSEIIERHRSRQQWKKWDIDNLDTE